LSSVKDIGITEKKDINFSEWYTQVVLKTQLADYAPVKGLMVLRPYGYSIWESIKAILDKQFKATGHQNSFLPLLIPENLLRREEEHFQGFNSEVFWVTMAGNNKLSEKLALRPTSETLAYTVYSKWITSYRDLPMKVNFWNSALRAEIKATKPFVRTSEFLWQEGHTVHATEQEAEDEVRLILEIYHDLVENYLAIPSIAGFKTDKERFVGAKYTTTLEGLMADGKALQLATSHHLGQNFSKPFEIKFLGKDGAQHYAWQTSWGISWRLIGALIMVHGDDKGLILPPRVAPIQVIIIPIFKDKDAKSVKSKANQLADELQKSEIRVYVDDREDYTAGWKFNEWETKGVPLRINIGPRDIEKNQAEFVRRDTGEKSFIEQIKMTEHVILFLNQIQDSLLLRARKRLHENITLTSNYNVLRSVLREKSGFILTGWCGDPRCECRIKEETGADIRVIPFEVQEVPDVSVCIYCRKQAKKSAFIARAY
jgi:prolyl-tRNA synthetase